MFSWLIKKGSVDENWESIKPSLNHRPKLTILEMVQSNGKSTYFSLFFIIYIHLSLGISTISPDKNNHLHIITRIVVSTTAVSKYM